MTVYIIILVTCSMLLGISKAAADIVQHIDLWNTSIFSSALENSFWGSKDKTWVRKDHPNKVINWLYHYPLVWITDVWHFANMINSLVLYPLFVCFHYLQMHIFIMLVLVYSIRTLTFNLFYHIIFKKHGKKEIKNKHKRI